MEAMKKAIEDQSLRLKDSALPIVEELHAAGRVLIGSAE